MLKIWKSSYLGTYKRFQQNWRPSLPLSPVLHPRFTTLVENASTKNKDVPSAGQATASLAEGQKNTKDADTNLKDELVDLLGKNVVTQYYTKKLLFDKYCDKMLKRKKSPKITNCEERDIESKELTLPINAKCNEELSYLSNKLNRTAEAKASVLVIIKLCSSTRGGKFHTLEKRFMCHIVGIEPQFENIIKNGPYVPMAAGQRKPEVLWTVDERKAANLDQRLKSLIMSDYQDSPNDEEDTRSSHEYLNDLKEEYQARDLLAKTGHFARGCFTKTSVPSYQSPFHSKQISSSIHKPELRPTKDFEAKYNKVKAKLALLSSSASPSKSTMVKNKGLIAEAYKWDEEEVSSDDNEMVEVKVLMALAEDNDAVSKEGAINGEWVKISMRKCNIRKPIWYLDSGCSRHMTGVKSYLHKYVEQPGPKFDEKRGTIFNSNKEIVMIAPRVRDAYVLDMTSSEQESCFFARATENLNWLWHKDLLI
ncbi:hypothetical protein Tco_0411062 [Tanacetum coccineum]